MTNQIQTTEEICDDIFNASQFVDTFEVEDSEVGDDFVNYFDEEGNVAHVCALTGTVTIFTQEEYDEAQQ